MNVVFENLESSIKESKDSFCVSMHVRRLHEEKVYLISRTCKSFKLAEAWLEVMKLDPFNENSTVEFYELESVK